MHRFFIIIFIVGFMFPSSGMSNVLNSDQKSTIRIIDQNHDEKLEELLTPTELTSVFGATPRYSAYERFITTLKAHLSELYTNNKAGANKKSKHLVRTLAQSYCGNPAQLVNVLPPHVSFELFFSLGIDTATLLENMGLLTKFADSLPRSLGLHVTEGHLIHLLLPCYFDDLDESKLSLENLHSFLKSAASFYKRLYEQCNHNYRITLVIPHLKHFEKIINRPKIGPADQLLSEHKEHSILEVLLDVVIRRHASAFPLMLINQRKEELVSLIHGLTAAGIAADKIGMAHLFIQAGSGFTTIFNPYIIRNDREYNDYKNSPLIVPDLLEYLQKGLT